jgi:hypothetical protein
MAEAKTLPTDASVDDFIDAIEPEQKRQEAKVLDRLMRRITGQEPVMWGNSIIGYGEYRSTNTRGEVRWMPVGYHPAKANHSLHLTGACHDREAMAEQKELLAWLGPHTSGVSCLYIKRLDAIDMEVLAKIVALHWDRRKKL